MHAMTGPWMTVKWLGISIAAIYLVLLLIVIVRFRRDMSRLHHGFWPAVLGPFVSVSIPSIFEDVTVARFCFVVTTAIYVGGIAILLRSLAQTNHQGLWKVEG